MPRKHSFARTVTMLSSLNDVQVFLAARIQTGIDNGTPLHGNWASLLYCHPIGLGLADKALSLSRPCTIALFHHGIRLARAPHHLMFVIDVLFSRAPTTAAENTK
jgi:hypothetical protein